MCTFFWVRWGVASENGLHCHRYWAWEDKSLCTSESMFYSIFATKSKMIEVVVSNIFKFHPEILGKWSTLTNIFQTGWFNHELVIDDDTLLLRDIFFSIAAAATRTHQNTRFKDSRPAFFGLSQWSMLGFLSASHMAGTETLHETFFDGWVSQCGH